MALVYLIQHGDKQRLLGDPGLTATGSRQAVLTGRWLRSAGLRALYSSPLRRARETADLIAAGTWPERVLILLSLLGGRV